MKPWEWHALEDRPAVAGVPVEGGELRPGARVRLKPRAGGDILDLALAGQLATVEAIEQDYESQSHLAVVLDDDPGRDLGLARQPGHRFFFRPDEVEFVEAAPETAAAADRGTTVLVAGIGNIFFGDDGFGVEVARRLSGRTLPVDVRVADFGIRGFDLACALDSADVTILVDAYPHGAAPGAITVIEPELPPDDGAADGRPPGVEPHGLDPVSVLRLARAMHLAPGRVLLVGCEPATLGGEDGHMGLSAPVAAAVDDAVRTIEALVRSL